MKIRRILSALLFFGLFYSELKAASHDQKRAIRDRDFQAVQEYVNSKRTIPMDEKAKHFALSADVRFDWASVREKVNGNELRGSPGLAKENENTGAIIISDQTTQGNAGLIPFSNNEFNVELNLYFDYLCDRSWAVAWLQFDNRAGSDRSFKTCFQDPQGFHGSGNCDSICLKKAYIGYNICVTGCARLDVELGRRPLYNVFDSRVQFQSRFDGILFRYAQAIGQYGDFYNNTGFFVVDERASHFAWVTEAGLLNLYDKGIDLKYSFIDWKSLMNNHRNRCNTRNPFGANFQISQWTFHYHFLSSWLCQAPSKFYAAVLLNHAARGWERTQFRKENVAWYVGLIIGEVCREGDWALDINYQYVEAQAIPCQDVSGIGERANLLKETFTADGRGFTNYKGLRVEFLYAITDNLAVDATLEILSQIDRSIGGTHSYSMFELSAIYAF